MSADSSVIETVILGSLIHNTEYAVSVLPHAKAEFFEQDPHKILFELCQEYHVKYGSMPTQEAISVELQALSGLEEEIFRECDELVDKLYEPNVRQGLLQQDKTWLMERTEKQFKDRACYLAIMRSIDIIDGTDKKFGRDAIPDLLAEAVKIDFNTDVGHDYFEDWEGRHEYYNRVENKLELPLYMLNKVTNNGITKKSLTLAVAGTNVGKTIMLTNCAAHYTMRGQKVLYVTLEMAEEDIAQRIDARLMQATMEEVKRMSKEKFNNAINRAKSAARGNLVIKQYPPRSITVKSIEALLSELKQKKNFVPDVICLDYLTLLNSYMLGRTGADNLYITGKYVAEEVRALAVRKEIAIISASQTNRNGQTDQDFDLTDLGESHAISQTADFMFGMMTNPEMEKMGHIRIKLLKSRFGSISQPSSFIVGLDKSRMTFYDLDIQNDAPVETPAAQQVMKQEPAGKKNATFVFD